MTNKLHASALGALILIAPAAALLAGCGSGESLADLRERSCADHAAENRADCLAIASTMNEKTLRDLIAEGEQIEAEQKKAAEIEKGKAAYRTAAGAMERCGYGRFSTERAEQRCLDRYWDEVKP